MRSIGDSNRTEYPGASESEFAGMSLRTIAMQLLIQRSLLAKDVVDITFEACCDCKKEEEAYDSYVNSQFRDMMRIMEAFEEACNGQ